MANHEGNSCCILTQEIHRKINKNVIENKLVLRMFCLYCKNYRRTLGNQPIFGACKAIFPHNRPSSYRGLCMISKMLLTNDILIDLRLASGCISSAQSFEFLFFAIQIDDQLTVWVDVFDLRQVAVNHILLWFA